MLNTLATLPSASLRMVLACYAQQHDASKQAVYACLKDESWAPTPDDCPVDWTALERWYRGLQRTGDLVMDSY